MLSYQLSPKLGLVQKRECTIMEYIPQYCRLLGPTKTETFVAYSLRRSRVPPYQLARIYGKIDQSCTPYIYKCEDTSASAQLRGRIVHFFIITVFKLPHNFLQYAKKVCGDLDSVPRNTDYILCGAGHEGCDPVIAINP